jgi:hypothetical protein
MSGIKDFNFPAFMAAAASLREQGYTVFNPAEKDLEIHRKEIFEGNGDVAECEAKGFSLREAMRWDMNAICDSDAIALLPGWELSGGARAEWALAACLRLKFIYL